MTQINLSNLQVGHSLKIFLKFLSIRWQAHIDFSPCKMHLLYLRVCTWIVIGHSQFTLWSLNSPEWPQRYNKYRTNLIFLINTTNYATLFFMQGIKGLCPPWMGHKIRAEKTWSVTYNTNLNLVRKRYQYISSTRYETITQNTYSRSCSSSSCAQSTKEDIFVLKMFTNCFSA